MSSSIIEYVAVFGMQTMTRARKSAPSTTPPPPPNRLLHSTMPNTNATSGKKNTYGRRLIVTWRMPCFPIWSYYLVEPARCTRCENQCEHRIQVDCRNVLRCFDAFKQHRKTIIKPLFVFPNVDMAAASVCEVWRLPFIHTSVWIMVQRLVDKWISLYSPALCSFFVIVFVLLFGCISRKLILLTAA